MNIPEEWQEKFYLIFWDDNSERVELTKKEAESLKKIMLGGAKYVEVGQLFLAVSSIKAIVPRYGMDNIPPYPKNKGFLAEGKSITEEQDLWNQLFKNNQKLLS